MAGHAYGREIVVLIDDIRDAVNRGVRNGCEIRPSERTWEVDVLVGLFRVALPLLDRAFRAAAIGSGLTTRLGGIFCHQSPKLTFGPNDTCEIGDLLVVVKYGTTAPPIYTALLLQTKMSSGEQLGSDDTQYELYVRWPTFAWVKSGDSRTVTDPRPNRGAQIGTIDACADGCPQCTATVMVPGGQARELAEELFDLFHRGSGREFDTEQAVIDTGRTDWSRVVWDLLRFTVGSVVYNWKRAQESGSPRPFGISGIFLMPGTLDPTEFFAPLPSDSDEEITDFAEAWKSDMFSPPDEPFDPTFSDRQDDDSLGGVSTIFIDVGQDTERDDEGGSLPW